MSKITKNQQQSIVNAAQHAARQHPWRASYLEVIDLDRDYDHRISHDRKPQLSARGREVQRLWIEAFTAASAEIPPYTGGPGGEPCDRCGQPVEVGRWNVCRVCAAGDE